MEWKLALSSNLEGSGFWRQVWIDLQVLEKQVFFAMMTILGTGIRAN